MLAWLRNLFVGSTCAFCKRKTNEKRRYLNDKGKPIAVCTLCIEYAERRAYRRKA
jgi:hypothetical protein